MSHHKHVIDVWENTYRMEPEEDERFRPHEVEGIVREELEKVKNTDWDEKTAESMATELAATVRSRARTLNIPRYKLVVQAVVGQVKGQGAEVASRCLWDIKTDNYASYSIKNETLFATIIVFGLYLE